MADNLIHGKGRGAGNNTLHTRSDIDSNQKPYMLIIFMTFGLRRAIYCTSDASSSRCSCRGKRIVGSNEADVDTVIASSSKVE